MRTAPLGLLPFLDAETSFRLGAEAAALTHGHPNGYLSAGMIAALVRLFLAGTPLTAPAGAHDESGAVDQCGRFLLSYSGHQGTLAAVHHALALAANKTVPHTLAVQKLGGGWVGEEALAIAIYAVLSAGSYVEAISIAANHSGDSDSTASIAGQLWGAAHGLDGIPHEWVSNLDVLLPLLRLARVLLSLGGQQVT